MRIAIAALTAAGMTLGAAAMAQEMVTEGTLRGQWSIDGARNMDFIGFGPDGEFASGYVSKPKLPKDAVSAQPTVKSNSGAYKVGDKSCNAGSQTGNLFLAQSTQRCCFKAYMLGKTLVLDELRSGGTPSLLPLCHSKTLTRFGAERK